VVRLSGSMSQDTCAIEVDRLPGVLGLYIRSYAPNSESQPHALALGAVVLLLKFSPSNIHTLNILRASLIRPCSELVQTDLYLALSVFESDYLVSDMIF
jgi:hypothetical protein